MTSQEAERRANAALNVAFSIAFVAGPVIGGAVVAAAGAPAALFIDVGSFLICGALLLDLHPHVEEAGGDSVRARLRAAWTHINEAPALRALLLAEAVALVFIEAGGPIEVAYVKATLHAGDRGYGLLVTAWGAGAVLGSVVFARFVRRSLGVMLSAGTFALGAAFVGFALAPSLALACLAALVGGVGNGLEWPSLISLVQRLTPQRLHGRLDGRGRIARRPGSGDRPVAGRRACRAQLDAGGVPGGRAGGGGDHRRIRAPDADGARTRGRRACSTPRRQGARRHRLGGPLPHEPAPS